MRRGNAVLVVTLQAFEKLRGELRPIEGITWHTALNSPVVVLLAETQRSFTRARTVLDAAGEFWSAEGAP
jgi:hypothetical protein